MVFLESLIFIILYFYSSENYWRTTCTIRYDSVSNCSPSSYQTTVTVSSKKILEINLVAYSVNFQEKKLLYSKNNKTCFDNHQTDNLIYLFSRKNQNPLNQFRCELSPRTVSISSDIPVDNEDLLKKWAVDFIILKFVFFSIIQIILVLLCTPKSSQFQCLFPVISVTLRRIYGHNFFMERRTNTFQQCCCICLEEYQDDWSKQILELPCDHWFHRDCLNMWLEGKERVCPICKATIPERFL